MARPARGAPNREASPRGWNRELGYFWGSQSFSMALTPMVEVRQKNDLTWIILHRLPGGVRVRRGANGLRRCAIYNSYSGPPNKLRWLRGHAPLHSQFSGICLQNWPVAPVEYQIVAINSVAL